MLLDDHPNSSQRLDHPAKLILNTVHKFNNYTIIHRDGVCDTLYI